MKKKVDRSAKARLAYQYLLSLEKAGGHFTVAELSSASGWAQSTTRRYISIKLDEYIEKVGGRFSPKGVLGLTEDSFCRLFSQKTSIVRNPEKPRLKSRVEALVVKSREAALAAVQHYNNPTAKFRSGNFTVLMVIAYTSLFHAIWERDEVDYRVRKANGSLMLSKGGDPYLWPMITSARRYFDEGGHPVLANLEFMRQIRDKLEHRFLPALDPELVGHCQAMLLNFEKILSEEFGPYFSINCSLAIALQISTQRPHQVVSALRRLQSSEYVELRKFLVGYRESLTDEILASSDFCFRAWLVPKTANRESSSDMAIEFVRIEDAEPWKDIESRIVAMRTKTEFIDASAACQLWEKEVVKQLRLCCGNVVRIEGQLRKITSTLVRNARDYLGIASPSAYYYRPNKDGDRPRYSDAFVELVRHSLEEDPEFFSKARIASRSTTL